MTTQTQHNTGIAETPDVLRAKIRGVLLRHGKAARIDTPNSVYYTWTIGKYVATRRNGTNTIAYDGARIANGKLASHLETLLRMTQGGEI